MSLFIGCLVEVESLRSVDFVRNDGCGATIFEPLAKVRAVIGSVAQKLFGSIATTDQSFCNRAVVRLAARQEQGKKTAFSICDCVYFCIAPAIRASNRLILLPPFPPEAERCALMCVESIICV